MKWLAGDGSEAGGEPGRDARAGLGREVRGLLEVLNRHDAGHEHGLAGAHVDDLAVQAEVMDEVTAGLLGAGFRLSRLDSHTFVLQGEQLSADESRPLLGRPTPRSFLFALPG